MQQRSGVPTSSAVAPAGLGSLVSPPACSSWLCSRWHPSSSQMHGGRHPYGGLPQGESCNTSLPSMITGKGHAHTVGRVASTCQTYTPAPHQQHHELGYQTRCKRRKDTVFS